MAAHPFDLSGRLALVTGGGSGSGLRDRGRPGARPERASSQRAQPREARGGRASSCVAEAATRRASARSTSPTRRRSTAGIGEIERAIGADRHPRQQRGGQPSQAAAGVLVRRMARAAGGQSRRAVPRDARGAAGHAGAPARQDHQHLLARVRHRAPAHRRLRGQQGRAQDADPRAGGRGGAVQRAGERHRARILQDRDERAAHRQPGILGVGRASARPPGAGASRPRSPARPCSWRRARPTTSPGICSTSTAGSARRTDGASTLVGRLARALKRARFAVQLHR